MRGSSSEPPAGDGAYRTEDVGRSHLLEEVAGGAGHDRFEQRLVVSERREHQARELWHLGLQLAADGDAVAIRQPYVEDRHVAAVVPELG